jgi:hypothetical protein
LTWVSAKTIGRVETVNRLEQSGQIDRLDQQRVGFELTDGGQESRFNRPSRHNHLDRKLEVANVLKQAEARPVREHQVKDQDVWSRVEQAKAFGQCLRNREVPSASG